jgi:hypothetical protein
VRNLVFWLAVVCGVIWVDHVQGGVFSDPFYCLVGAGRDVVIPGSTRANTWDAACGSQRPECATNFIHTPSQEVCYHTTVWDAIKRSKFYASVKEFGREPGRKP